MLRQGGRLIDQGTHDELLDRCDLYRRIFAHYDEVAASRPRPSTAMRSGATSGDFP